MICVLKVWKVAKQGGDRQERRRCLLGIPAATVTASTLAGQQSLSLQVCPPPILLQPPSPCTHPPLSLNPVRSSLGQKSSCDRSQAFGKEGESDTQENNSHSEHSQSQVFNSKIWDTLMGRGDGEQP